ncbi:MAG: hypothetical protein HYT09_01360, partial [Candidatus Levybacteria bacterium]|nr:hypothetical protein [Candidatus Levybacteria bacterium]
MDFVKVNRAANKIYLLGAIVVFLLISYFLAFNFDDQLAGAVGLVGVIGIAYLYHGLYGSEEEAVKAIHQPYTIFKEHGIIGAIIFFIISAATGFSFISLSTQAAAAKYSGDAVGRILPSLPYWMIVIAFLFVALQYH